MTRLLLSSALALLIIGGLVLLGEYLAIKSFGLDTDSGLSNILRIALLTVATYAGIIGQVLTVRLKQLSAKQVSIINELRAVTSSKDFWIAIVASPLVLAAAYGAITQVTSIILVCFIGFQNGFFFHSVLSRHEPHTDRS
jgi:hypothetical protein